MAKINTSIIKRVRETLAKIEASLYPTLKDVFTQRADVIKGIQTDVQLFSKGEDSQGLTIHPDYADSTISLKISKGQPTDRVTLKDTGNFYNSIRVIAEQDRLIIETSISYAKFLVDKYGEDILGIQDMEMKEFFLRFIKPEIERNINNIISDSKL